MKYTLIVLGLLIFFVGGCKKESETQVETFDACAPKEISRYRGGFIRGTLSGKLSDSTSYTYPFYLKYEIANPQFRSELSVGSNYVSMRLSKGDACGRYIQINIGLTKLPEVYPYNVPVSDSTGANLNMMYIYTNDSTYHQVSFFPQGNDAIDITLTSYDPEKKLLKGTFNATDNSDGKNLVLSNGEFEIPFYKIVY